MKRVLFISSTGGHFAELLALEPLFKKYDYHIAVERDTVSLSYLERYGERITFLPRGARARGIAYLGTLCALILASVRLARRFKPEVIVTTGSRAGIPMCYLAKLLNARVVYIETIANRTSRTLSGRLAYPIADLFIVQWESMLELYPRAEYAGWIFS